ncbi:MAG: pentapeptide repeat-containing protein [Methanothrix sp.]
MREMCIGIGIVVVVEEDDTMKIYGKTGNSSHDTILHEMVPVDLHNRVAKIEYTFPHSLRLDAPDLVCRQMALDLGVAEVGPVSIRLKSGVVEAVQTWIRVEGVEFTANTLQGANLREADLGEADLRGANLGEADLRGANLGEADLRGANLGGANLGGANLGEADLRRANLREAALGGARIEGTIGMEAP